MFKLVAGTMISNDPLFYEESYDFLFREFIDLKMVIDPWHERDVLVTLLYNLSAHLICLHTNVESMWLRSYAKEPFNIELQLNVSARDYADRAESNIKAYNGIHSNLEIIRLLLCYSKAKGYDTKSFFNEYVNKLKIVHLLPKIEYK